MTYRRNTGVHGHAVYHLKQGDRQRRVTPDDIRRVCQFKVIVVHNVQQFDVVRLQRCDLMRSLCDGNTVEFALVQLIPTGLFQVLKSLHGINAPGTELDMRIELSKINSRLLYRNLLAVQEHIIHHLHDFRIASEIRDSELAHCEPIAHLLELLQPFNVHLYGRNRVIDDKDDSSVRCTALALNIRKDGNVSHRHENLLIVRERFDSHALDQLQPLHCCRTVKPSGAELHRVEKIIILL